LKTEDSDILIIYIHGTQKNCFCANNILIFFVAQVDVPWNNFAIMFVHWPILRQPCKTAASKMSGFQRRGGKGTSKVGQVLEDEVRRCLLGRDRINYENKRWSNESYNLVCSSFTATFYNRISLLEKCFDDTLCNCNGSLNLNKQQLTRMCIER